jgi:hypothetical protein
LENSWKINENFSFLQLDMTDFYDDTYDSESESESMNDEGEDSGNAE